MGEDKPNQNSTNQVKELYKKIIDLFNSGNLAEASKLIDDLAELVALESMNVFKDYNVRAYLAIPVKAYAYLVAYNIITSFKKANRTELQYLVTEFIYSLLEVMPFTTSEVFGILEVVKNSLRSNVEKLTEDLLIEASYRMLRESKDSSILHM